MDWLCVRAPGHTQCVSHSRSICFISFLWFDIVVVIFTYKAKHTWTGSTTKKTQWNRTHTCNINAMRINEWVSIGSNYVWAVITTYIESNFPSSHRNKNAKSTHSQAKHTKKSNMFSPSRLVQCKIQVHVGFLFVLPPDPSRIELVYLHVFATARTHSHRRETQTDNRSHWLANRVLKIGQPLQ